MKCPFCGHPEDRAVDSRGGRDGGFIRRPRECLKCQDRENRLRGLQKGDRAPRPAPAPRAGGNPKQRGGGGGEAGGGKRGEEWGGESRGGTPTQYQRWCGPAGREGRQGRAPQRRLLLLLGLLLRHRLTSLATRLTSPAC